MSLGALHLGHWRLPDGYARMEKPAALAECRRNQAGEVFEFNIAVLPFRSEQITAMNGTLTPRHRDSEKLINQEAELLHEIIHARAVAHVLNVR